MLRTHNTAWCNIAWCKFCSLSLNIIKGGMGGETGNCPNSSFSQNFCHWLSEKIWKISNVVFYSWLFWITLKACSYPLRHYCISLNNFWSQASSLNIWVSEENLYLSDLFQIKLNYEHSKDDSTRSVNVHDIFFLFFFIYKYYIFLKEKLQSPGTILLVCLGINQQKSSQKSNRYGNIK